MMHNHRKPSGPAPQLERSLAIVCRNLFQEESAHLQLGHFKLLKTLGTGGRGLVYEAFDLEREERVAIKMLLEDGPVQRYRLKREFRSLAQLRHPNLVALHDLYITGEQAYFAMELVHGRDFGEYARDADDGSFRAALRQLADATHALHSAGKLHRDLKPSNVLVTSDNQVKLLDFGLVDDTRIATAEGARLDEAFAGTPRYMAPEQAHGAACESSDWYAFGVILAESLQARSLHGHAAQPDLERLAVALSVDAPERRAGYTAVAAALRSDPMPRRAAPPPRVPFVGRSSELRRLRELFEHSRRAPVVLSIYGESGLGKTALLREFLRTIALPAHAVVLEGQCCEREAIPYRGLDGLVDELARHLLSLSDDEGLALARIDQRAALLQVFPVLGAVPQLCSASPATGSSAEVRAQASSALKSLLQLMAARAPLLLCIDDFQHSDADSCRLLGEVLSDVDAPALLLVVCERAQSDPDEPLRASEALARATADVPQRPLHTELRLEPLTPLEAAELTSQLLANREDAAGAVLAESRGSPLWLRELASAIACGAEVAGAPSLDAVLAARLERVCRHGKAMLELLAVAGRPIAAEIVERAAMIGPERHVTVDALRAAELLQVVSSGGEPLLALQHARLAEAVLSGIEAERRRELHERLAAALVELEGQDAAGLIEYYLGAENPREAARRARRAAAVALKRLAFARAASLCEQALSLGEWTQSERAELLRELGCALENAARGIDAAAAYCEAARLTTDSNAALQLEQYASQLLMLYGRVAEGEQLLQRIYHRLGWHWPESRAALALATARQLVARGTRPQPSASFDLRAHEICDVGRGLDYYDPLRALHNALQCYAASEGRQDPVARARARGLRALLRCCFMPGRALHSIGELEQAHAMLAARGDTRTLATVEYELAMLCYFSAQPRAALAWIDRCDVHLRSLHVPPIERYSAVAFGNCALLDLGELRELARRSDALAREARLHGDPMTTLAVHSNPAQFMVLLVSGDDARARALLQHQARLRSLHPAFFAVSWAHAACGIEQALYHREPERALQLVQANDAALFRSGAPILTRTSRVLRSRALLAAAATKPRSSERAGWLRAAARDIAMLRGGGFAMQRGAALLLDASLALQCRGRERALSKIEAALPLIDAAELKLVAASARYCRGRLMGGDEGRALQLKAATVMRQESVVDPARCASWAAAFELNEGRM